MDGSDAMAWVVPVGLKPLLARGSDDGGIRVWDVETYELVRTFAGHDDGVVAVASVTLPEGQVLIATGGKDRVVRIWGLGSGRVLHRLDGHAGAVNAVAWTLLPDGQLLLASGGDDATVRIWDGVSGRELHRMSVGEGHVDLVWSLSWAVLPTGHVRLAAAVDDAEGAGVVHLWDGLTGAPLRKLTAAAAAGDEFGIVRRVVCLEVGRDGRLLVAANTGRRAVQVWDAATGERRYATASEIDVSSLAWVRPSAEQPVLLAVGKDRVLLVDGYAEQTLAEIVFETSDYLLASAATQIPGGPTLVATAWGRRAQTRILQIDWEAADPTASDSDAAVGADSVDDLIERVNKRIEAYYDDGDTAVLFGPGVEQDAAALWQLVRERGPRGVVADEDERLFEAAMGLGWFHSLRQHVIKGEGGLPDLARAVVCFASHPEAVDMMPSTMNRLLGATADVDEQAAFAIEFLLRSKQMDDPALLDAGIALLTPAAAALPDHDPDRMSAYSNLCLALHNRFKRDGTADDLTAAIAAGEQAVADPQMPAKDPVGPRTNLSHAYWDRFRLNRDPEDMRHAIALLEDTAASLEPGPNRSEWLTEMARACLKLYEHTDDPADMTRAVDAAVQAVQVLPAEPGAAVSALFTMAAALLARYHRTGTREDLGQAVQLVGRCLEAMPPGHPQRDSYAADAAWFFLESHAEGLDPDGLRKAAQLSEEAVAARRDDPSALSAMIAAPQERYRVTGVGTDLDRAIELAEQAPAADRRLRELLAGAYLARYQYAGTLDDVDRAIDLWQALFTQQQAGPSHRVGWASLLCSAYQQRFTAEHDIDDLRRAIEFGEWSVGRTLMRVDSGLGQRLGRLAIAYQCGHDVGMDEGHRSRAIELGEMAVKFTPQGNVERAGWISNLAIAYLTPGFTAVPTGEEIDRAVELSEKALAECSPDDVGGVRIAANLAHAHRVRALGDGQRIGASQLHELARWVADARAVPVDQVWGRHAVGTLALAVGETRLAVELLDDAVALLPGVAAGDAGLVDRQHRLGGHQGLVGSAIAAHCAVGDLPGAVEAAERGRALLLADRTPTGAVPNAPGGTRRFAELSSAAVGGAVVLVNAGLEQGDAVIVRADCPPVHVELPALRQDETRDRAMALAEATTEDGSLTARLRKQRVLPEILDWLWETIAAPVLAALPPGGSPHRVWWLPTGHLGVFPLHAAGHEGEPGVLDAAVSSYIPTVGALYDARARAAATARRQLVVAMNHTPGLPDLPGTAQEAADLHARHPGVLVPDEQATAEKVLTELAKATWAHFACHAEADLLSPASGGLRLHERILHLSEVMALYLSEAELAYLSACSTGHHGGRYADEVLDLASAFHLAGYRHVIASLWPLGDRIGAQAAHHFYRQMPATAAADAAAAVLHRVTLDLRAANPTRPDLWSALIHSGP